MAESKRHMDVPQERVSEKVYLPTYAPNQEKNR